MSHVLKISHSSSYVYIYMKLYRYNFITKIQSIKKHIIVRITYTSYSLTCCMRGVMSS